jgi:uncharacterized glyoxalase superfamily protein PhnB
MLPPNARQDFYVKALAETLMTHLLVENVDAWWDELQARRIGERCSVRTEPPAQRPWRMRDFVLIDPSGVLWRIAQNTD